MGSRGQIAIDQTDGRIYLYTHWSGNKIKDILKNALIRGKDRWEDDEYLTRIIFCEMIEGSVLDTTGFGIGLSEHGDIEYPIPIVNIELGTVDGVRFEEYIKE